MTDAERYEWVRRQVESAPPLSAEIRDRLRVLLRRTDQEERRCRETA